MSSLNVPNIRFLETIKREHSITKEIFFIFAYCNLDTVALSF